LFYYYGIFLFGNFKQKEEEAVLPQVHIQVLMLLMFWLFYYLVA